VLYTPWRTRLNSFILYACLVKNSNLDNKIYRYFLNFPISPLPHTAYLPSLCSHPYSSYCLKSIYSLSDDTLNYTSYNKYILQNTSFLNASRLNFNHWLLIEKLLEIMVSHKLKIISKFNLRRPNLQNFFWGHAYRPCR